LNNRREFEEHLYVDHCFTKKATKTAIEKDHVNDHDGDITQMVYDVDRPHCHPTGHLSPIQTSEVTYD